MRTTTPGTEISHPLFARFYTWFSQVLDRRGLAGQREALLAGLSGRVIEVGAGNGLNFCHYPPSVTGVLAVEPEPVLRAAARRAARAAPARIEVAGGLAERLPAADGEFDAAVVTFVLCSLPDPGAGLREIRRVLAPGGRLRFLEHVRAGSPGWARAQDLMDATVWPRLTGGCHTGRDSVAAIEAAGFTVESLDRFVFACGVRNPISFCVRGVARR
ncbi:class I SAM-dependent methyltransferase [Microbispora sp. H10949]|uniref:class I SAM-dependent methyltransferase n=1 Tax=Microbispora sp. H10949 TaxID=2729111 RepID=UPI001601AFA1|nr:class I SAM-dependent methyltransferase [Microbispora sp. H10949]